MTLVSVIIPTFNRTSLLKKALQHLAQGSHIPDEVILVDDASPEPVADHIFPREFPFHLTILRHDQNYGAPAARNKGIRQAKGDILIFQDDDILADYNMVHYHIKIHQDHPEPFYSVMGRIYFDPDLCRNPLMHYLEEFGAFKGITKSPDKTLVNTGLISANFSMKRQWLQSQETLFDEHFPFNRNEDTEFGLRMMEKGLKLYFHIAPSARHHSPLDIDTFCKQLRQGGASKAYWSNKRPDDSQHCFRLAQAIHWKQYEPQLQQCFENHLETFGWNFLHQDVCQSSPLRFNAFKEFMDTTIGWIYYVSLADGWMSQIPGFQDISQHIIAAMNSSKEKEKIHHLHQAYSTHDHFFPMVLLWSSELTRKGEYPEALRVLTPFKDTLWGKIKLAELNHHCEQIETCFELIYDVLANTRNGKAIEIKQRTLVTQLLETMEKKKIHLEMEKLWPLVTEDDLIYIDFWKRRVKNPALVEDNPEIKQDVKINPLIHLNRLASLKNNLNQILEKIKNSYRL